MTEVFVEPSRIKRPGKVLREWVIPEYTQHERGRGWFITAGMAIVILLLFSFWTPNWFFDQPNFLFATIIARAGITFLARHNRIPPLLSVVFYGDGISVGEAFYPWRELKTFWIIYEPPYVKTLYFHFQSAWRPRLPIPLEDENPVEIRQILLAYLLEDIERESEPTSDALSRLLRL